jgi:hypothetical protein
MMMMMMMMMIMMIIIIIIIIISGSTILVTTENTTGPLYHVVRTPGSYFSDICVKYRHGNLLTLFVVFSLQENGDSTVNYATTASFHIIYN